MGHTAPPTGLGATCASGGRGCCSGGLRSTAPASSRSSLGSRRRTPQLKLSELSPCDTARGHNTIQQTTHSVNKHPVTNIITSILSLSYSRKSKSLKTPKWSVGCAPPDGSLPGVPDTSSRDEAMEDSRSSNSELWLNITCNVFKHR